MRWGLWLFAAGGVFWVLKVVVITLNDLTGRDTDSMPVPVLYLSAATVLDETLKAAFEGVGPSWLHEELGILATGAISLGVGLWLAWAVSRDRATSSAPA